MIIKIDNDVIHRAIEASEVGVTSYKNKAGETVFKVYATCTTPYRSKTLSKDGTVNITEHLPKSCTLFRSSTEQDCIDYFRKIVAG